MNSNRTYIRRRFLDSLKRGTGEACLIMKEYPEIDFSDYIIKGALNNYAYDGQSEGSRAQYIYDLILLSDKKDKICQAVLEGLAIEQNDTWSLSQLFDLAKRLAKNGNTQAHKAIYDRFLIDIIDYSDWLGSYEIVELDGIKGFLFVAEKYGKHFEQYPEEVADTYFVETIQREYPDMDIYIELEKAAPSNPYVNLYLERFNQAKEIEKNRELEKPQQYDDSVDMILNINRYIPYLEIKSLDDSELMKIAEHLILEKKKTNQEKFLYIFTLHKFPLDSEFILKLALQKPSSKNRVREFAVDALSLLRSENIRKFALDKIATSSKPYHYVKILKSNYREGDCELLTNIAKRFKDEHIIENIARSYVDIYEANKTKECKKPLEALYDKMNCGIHRSIIIDILMENKVLSAKLKEEIKYDSYLDTRNIICE